jgi:hypothetical protein
MPSKDQPGPDALSTRGCAECALGREHAALLVITLKIRPSVLLARSRIGYRGRADHESSRRSDFRPISGVDFRIRNVQAEAAYAPVVPSWGVNNT